MHRAQSSAIGLQLGRSERYRQAWLLCFFCLFFCHFKTRNLRKVYSIWMYVWWCITSNQSKKNLNSLQSYV